MTQGISVTLSTGVQGSEYKIIRKIGHPQIKKRRKKQDRISGDIKQLKLLNTLNPPTADIHQDHKGCTIRISSRFNSGK